MIRFSPLLMLLFCMYFYQGFAQNVDPELEEKELIMYFKGEEEPYSGPCVGYYDNGQMGKKGEYVKGKMDGVWTWWYSNGQKKREGTYISGKKEGKWIDYYKDGTPRAAMSYTKDVYNGECAWWWENGNKKKITIYEDGVFMKKTEWNIDGSLKEGF